MRLGSASGLEAHVGSSSTFRKECVIISHHITAPGLPGHRVGGRAVEAAVSTVKPRVLLQSVSGQSVAQQDVTGTRPSSDVPRTL